MPEPTANPTSRSTRAGTRHSAAAPKPPSAAKTAAPAKPPRGSGPDLALAAPDTSLNPALLEGPTREEMIRLRAYDRYDGNGRIDGHDLDDWFAAEAEVGALLAEGNGPVRAAAKS